jgi:hypothetical protein
MAPVTPSDALDHPALTGATVVELTTAEEHAAFTAGDAHADVVVLSGGVLGALRDPLIALRAAHARCRTAAVIATPAIAIGGRATTSLWRFGDDGWTPTRTGLEGVCRTAGFARTELIGTSEPAPAIGDTATWDLVLRAWR